MTFGGGQIEQVAKKERKLKGWLLGVVCAHVEHWNAKAGGKDGREEKEVRTEGRSRVFINKNSSGG